MSVAPEKSERDPFEQLAETFVARYRAGERPSVQEYADRYPELADQIRALFPALVMMEEHRPGKEELASVTPRGLDVSKIPKQLGEYRILREVGRGGMGVVYEAVQETLGRHVALKVLPFNPLANPTHLERFRREARTAARLHHTHIVPVFGVGEWEGIHFFAMQFIHGQGLDDVLQEVRRLRRQQDPTVPGRGAPGESLAFSVAESLLTGQFSSSSRLSAESVSGQGSNVACDHSLLTTHHSPTSSDLTSQTESKYFRSVAQIGLQVAEALAYAHGQGVLHRDIKPSNLLLDMAGQVWITDFGLAKTEESDELTRTGDMVGTLRYMAPERLSGKADPRSDVYGLGITLYEMLTLRPAFADSARHEVIKKVVEEDPPSPHKLDRKVPRDLETIVLKAIAKDPPKRYVTAENMAEDLRRFLADRPIEARRSSATEQAWRWCRRNPTVAALTAALFLLLAAIAVVASVGYAQTALALSREAKQRGLADLALAREAEQRGLADEALTREAEQRGLAEQEAVRNRNLAYAADMQLAAQLWENEPASARPVAELLQAYIPKPGEKGLREFTWFYQQRLLHDAHELPVDQPVLRVGFTPVGHILTFEASHIRCREKMTGKVVRQRWVPGGWSFDFTSDGRLAAIGGDGRVIFYDTTTGQEQLFLQGLSQIKDIAFSPHGEALAVIQADGRTRAWEVPTGKQLATFAVSQTSRFCALSADAKTLVLAPYPNHNELSIYRAGQKDPQIIRARHVTIGAMVYSPDGRTIVAGDNHGHLDLYDATTGERKHTFPPMGLRVDALAFSSDGRRLCVGRLSGLVTVWNMVTRRPMWHLKGHTTKVGSVAFAADGQMLVSAGEEGTVRLWELPPISEPRILRKGAGQERVAYSGDGRWLAAGGYHTFLWDARTYRLEHQLPRSCSVAFSPDSKILATAGDESQVWLWEPSTGRLLRTISARPGEPIPNRRIITALSFSPDGKLLAAGMGHQNWFAGNYAQVAKVWEVASGKEVAELPHDSTVPALQFSPDGRTLATACQDHRIRLWQVGSWQVRLSWEGPYDFAAVAFVPGENQLVTGNGDGILQLWDPDTGQPLRPLGQHAHRVNSLAFSPDGKTLASGGSDLVVKLWSMASGRELRTLRGHTSYVSGLAFAGDGQALVSIAENDGVQLWDTLPPWQRLAIARTALQDEIASGPESAEAHYELALGYQRLGREDEALAEFSKAIDLNPNSIPVFNQRSVIYLREGEWEKATADFARLAKLEPSQHLHWYRLAGHYLQMGETEEYLQICREMVTRFGNTDRAEVADRVAKTCLLAPDAISDLGPILKLADQAVTGTEKDPNYHWFVLTKALAEYRAGHYAAAIKRLSRFSPQVGGVHYDAISFAVLAMAKYRLSVGRKPPSDAEPIRLAEDARAALNHAEAILSQKMPDPKAGRPFGASWPFHEDQFLDWLHARILTNEAKALLNKTSSK
jgi:WD40 repeat protein/serine/threonine protein kinase